LSMTSVASCTILSSTTSLWTLILTTVLRIEKFNWFKLAGIVSDRFQKEFSILFFFLSYDRNSCNSWRRCNGCFQWR
jgi:hypothetical protein